MKKHYHNQTEESSDFKFYEYGDSKWDNSRPADAEYTYHAADGSYAYDVLRQGRGDEKAFKIGRVNTTKFGNREPGDKDWLSGYGECGPDLYHLLELLAAPKGSVVWICEGEPDTDVLRSHGQIATTNPGGAGNWKAAYSAVLTGKHVIICEDNDESGRERTKWIRKSARKVAASISVVRFEDMPEKSDVRDFFEAGGTLEQLQGRVEKLDELIFISTETAEMVDRIEAQLLRSGVEIFGRSDSLVRVVVSENGDVLLHGMSPHDLRDHISRHCNFAKYGKAKPVEPKAGQPTVAEKSEHVPAAATLDMANSLLSRVGRWSFKEINGVHTAPIVRPDGEIVSTAGFDEQTGLYLVLPKGQVQIGDSRAEAEAALAALTTEVLGEFPIVNDVDLAVMMAGLLTPLVRAVIMAAPMIAVRAHTPGTGKSYYVDCVSMLALGLKANGLTMTPGNEEENKKLLSAVAMEGRPIISIDNVNGALRGDFIAQLIERPTVKPRILGKSEAPTIANVFCVYCNGNNLIIEGDLTRRVLLANLDAEMERPETRDFKGNPVRLLAGNREKYLGYALTIIRAYLVSGQRVALDPFGSFEDWSRMVREPLVWLGMADPVDSVEAVRADDPELAAMSALFAAWPANGREFSVGDLIEASGDRASSIDDSPLRRALLEVAGDRETINRKRLGAYLSGIKRRPVGGRYVEARMDKKTKTNVYSLVVVKRTSEPELKLAA